MSEDLTSTEVIMRALGSIEGKVDLLVAEQTTHTIRIGALEKYRNFTAGAVAIITAGVTYLFTSGKLFH